MERALAVLLGGVGMVVLTLFAVAQAGSEDPPARRAQLSLEFASPAPLPPEVRNVVAIAASGSTAAPGSRAPAPPATSVPANSGPGSSGPSTTTTSAPPDRRAVAELNAVTAEIAEGGVVFAFGEATLEPRGRALLDRLAAALLAESALTLRVTGHTDAVGPDAVNEPLSLARAEAVIDHLVAAGVAPNRLVAEGMGPRQPKASNDSAEGRQANRRSEVSVEGAG